MRSRVSWTALAAVLACVAAGSLALAGEPTLVLSFCALGVVLALLALRE